ncbi:hypothetical protein cyc_08100 [Cyclospora cayetanensis]|uniref:Uncharacterized protein n=1 Tax=Cyclospora cayetanensis TaxID=88456 RepID=A0A1D3CRL6_9EIME|nr:hypothetical protein cyc_08100 [Cyclospora cayetanensis]
MRSQSLGDGFDGLSSRRGDRWTLSPYSTGNRIQLRILQRQHQEPSASEEGNISSCTIPLSWLNRRRSPRLWFAPAAAAAAAAAGACARLGHHPRVTAAAAAEAANAAKGSVSSCLQLEGNESGREAGGFHSPDLPSTFKRLKREVHVSSSRGKEEHNKNRGVKEEGIRAVKIERKDEGELDCTSQKHGTPSGRKRGREGLTFNASTPKRERKGAALDAGEQAQ